jgi:sugar fermentation stimulation protein A
MKYKNIFEGTFIERPHRFGAMVDIGGKAEYVHVKNTGRCRELLIPGARVFLERSSNQNRKTAYSLISVMRDNLLINIDSQVPNKVVEESITKGMIPQFRDVALLKRERTYGNSRFDLYFERENGRKGFIEVKGVTLDVDGVAMFPDAPTERGLKHLLELKKALAEGYEAYVFFLIQYSPVKSFTPNFLTDSQFSKGLKAVNEAGVGYLVYDSVVNIDSITLGKPVKKL